VPPLPDDADRQLDEIMASYTRLRAD
jgi:hypothetical protein